MAAEAEEPARTAKQRRRAPLLDKGRERPTGGQAAWCPRLILERLQRRGSLAEDKEEREEEEEEAHRLMARGSGSGRWSRQRMGFLNTMLRCNLPPETQKVVVFIIMMLLIVINVVLMFLLAFQ